MEKLLRSDLRSGLRKLERKRQKQVLAAPNAILDQKAARIANYELAKAEVSQWESTVTKNRLADHMVFPAPPTDRVTMPESNEERKIRGDVFVQKALEQAKEGSQDLDAKVYAALYPGEAADKFVQKTTALVKESDDEFEPPDKQSLQDRLALRRIVKVKQGQLAAKMRQRKKIRSKNFHRHLKRQRVAEEAKQLTELATGDPNAFKEKLERMEKLRVEERMTQRHRQGGKWARQMKAFQKMSGKGDVNEMQEKAKLLLKKHQDDDEEEEEEKMEQCVEEDGWTTVLRRPPPRPEPAARLQDIHNVEMEEEEGLEVGVERKTAMEDFENMDTGAASFPQRPVAAAPFGGKKSAGKPQEVVIRFGATVTSSLAGLDPVTEVESQLEQLVGEQADELEAEFQAEKEEVAKEEQPAGFDAFLPGWNAWTGPGIEATKSQAKKHAKFSFKAPTLARKDEGQARLVIRERRTGSAAYRRHQVREVPFPYETAEAWEAATRQPIGRLWNTELTHRDLIRPRVAVRMGRIIKPMSRNQLYERAEKKEKKLKKQEKRKGKKKETGTGTGKRPERTKGRTFKRGKKS